MSAPICSMDRMRAVRLTSQIRERRKEAGMKQCQLARAAGMSQGSLSHIEAGDVVPSLATAMRLLAPLGLTLEVVSASGSKVVPVSRDDGGETPHAEVAQ